MKDNCVPVYFDEVELLEAIRDGSHVCKKECLQIRVAYITCRHEEEFVRLTLQMEGADEVGTLCDYNTLFIDRQRIYFGVRGLVS